jgi:hypothetical protein
MDIIQRNLMRLLRCGAFGQPERIEPMTNWKWERLYKLSLVHGITPWIRDGIRRSADDFFLQITPTLRQQFDNDHTTTQETPAHEELSNPWLNAKLQQLSEEAGTEDATFNLLLRLIDIARNIMTQGISLRQLVMLGVYLRTTKDPIEWEVLRTWIGRLEMERMARLEASLLVELFHFDSEEIGFADSMTDRSIRRAVDDIFQLTEKKAADWYFTQGKSIFVRTNDSGAMMWHVKQSARYMRYYPAEAVTNFISNFAHSLAHIEE